MAEVDEEPNKLTAHELVSTAEKQLPILRLRDGSIVTGAIQIRRELSGTA